jgi:hypothetical protein
MKAKVSFLTALVTVFLAGPVLAQVESAPPQRPPAAAQYATPQEAREGFAWIPGRWAWDVRQQQYIWYPGHWAEMPFQGAMWVAGHWERRPVGWVWVSGYWASPYAPGAPPPARVVVIPPRPGADFDWVAGYWRWVNNGWVWFDGRWVVRPSPRARYVPGRWIRRAARWEWVDGRWD